MVFSPFLPEHFETTMINATSLSALDICEVCGSYQCPYCPSYSGRSSTLLPHHTLLLLLPMLPSLLIPFPHAGILVITLLLSLFLIPSSLLVVPSSGPFHFCPQPSLLMAAITLLFLLPMFPFLLLVASRLLKALQPLGLQRFSFVPQPCLHILFPSLLLLLPPLSFPRFLVLPIFTFLLLLLLLLLLHSTWNQSGVSFPPSVRASLLHASSQSSSKYKGIQDTNIKPEDLR